MEEEVSDESEEYRPSSGVEVVVVRRKDSIIVKERKERKLELEVMKRVFGCLLLCEALAGFGWV